MSTIKVNTVTKRTGSTLTLGESGTTVTLACGATQTGFGRSGSVNWQTTPKTATFTAVNGEGYFANTNGGAFTINLPAGSAGAIVAVSDYTRTFATNNLTIAPNGSEKIGGIAETLVLNINGQALTLVYVDATEGWINVQNAEDTETGITAAFVTATGGAITTSGDYKIHTFNSDATFAVSCAGNLKGSDTVSYVVVAGGGGGGQNDYPDGRGTGGGGAGGFREGYTLCSYTASPLATTALPISVGCYPITVGGGGAVGAGPSPAISATAGSNSVFSTITSTGGGIGGSHSQAGGTGGSGGGGSNDLAGGAGNTPPTSPAQGTAGGAGAPNPSSPPWSGGGGGGATAVGANGTAPTGGNGGAGATSSINGTPTARAGGGGGGSGGTAGSGGTGGGGAGSSNPSAATAGTANTGGGGGGSGIISVAAGAGGSGVVVIRYKFQ